MSVITMGMASPSTAGLITIGFGNARFPKPKKPPKKTKGASRGGPWRPPPQVLLDMEHRQRTTTIEPQIDLTEELAFVSKYNLQEDILNDIKRSLRTKDQKIKELTGVIKDMKDRPWQTPAVAPPYYTGGYVPTFPAALSYHDNIPAPIPPAASYAKYKNKTKGSLPRIVKFLGIALLSLVGSILFIMAVKWLLK